MRLIDADALIDAVKKKRGELRKRKGTLFYRLALNLILGDIEDVPTIDAVPVIRCKDCKHRGGYHCPMYHTETSLDDLDGFDDYNVDKTDGDGFCHRGERRE